MVGHAQIYRLSGGRIGHRFPGMAPMLLLDHVGAKSGTQRTTPLLYIEEGGRYVVVASVGGAPKHPAWYLNLGANPAATVQVGRRRLGVSAETAGAARGAGARGLAAIRPFLERDVAGAVRALRAAAAGEAPRPSP